MRPEKEQLARDIQGLMGLSSSLFLITYSGLGAESFGDFRARLDGVGAECHVVPNRIFRIAARSAGFEALADQELTGDTAMVSGGEDVVAVAKVIRDFGRENRQVAMKLALVEGSLTGPEGATALADLPPREVLLAQLLGVLQAPATQLAGVLQAKAASIVYVLSAFQKSKEDAA